MYYASMRYCGAAQRPTFGQRLLHVLRLLFFTSISLVLVTTSLEKYPLSLLSQLFVLSNPPLQLLISTSESLGDRRHMSSSIKRKEIYFYTNFLEQQK